MNNSKEYDVQNESEPESVICGLENCTQKKQQKYKCNKISAIQAGLQGSIG